MEFQTLWISFRLWSFSVVARASSFCGGKKKNRLRPFAQFFLYKTVRHSLSQSRCWYTCLCRTTEAAKNRITYISWIYVYYIPSCPTFRLNVSYCNKTRTFKLSEIARYFIISVINGSWIIVRNIFVLQNIFNKKRPDTYVYSAWLSEDS